MTKLNKKLSRNVLLIVILVYMISMGINNIFVHKYYLYEEKNILNKIGEEIQKQDLNVLINNIDAIEEKYKTTIVYVRLYSGYLYNYDYLNEDIKNRFSKKGINLNKFWIEKDTLKGLEDKSINKIYNQGKMKYSLLVKIIKKQDYMFVVSNSIEHSEETIKIINKFNTIVSTISIIIIVLLITLLSNKIIKPIEKLKLLASDISKLNFRKEVINTNDEIEELANSINAMSEELEKVHTQLSNRNESLKRFIADTSHELKTPIAIIKAYSMGINDGIDDGTYLDTIIQI